MEFNPVISDPVQRDNDFPASMMSFLCNSKNEKLVGTVFLAQGKDAKPWVAGKSVVGKLEMD